MNLLLYCKRYHTPSTFTVTFYQGFLPRSSRCSLPVREKEKEKKKNAASGKLLIS